MCLVRNITFVLEEEAFQPDGSQGGDDGGPNDLPGFQALAPCVDLLPALLQVDQHHLLVHLQGTLDTHKKNKNTLPVSLGHFTTLSSVDIVYVLCNKKKTLYLFFRLIIVAAAESNL